jgi:hypothetical protein
VFIIYRNYAVFRDGVYVGSISAPHDMAQTWAREDYGPDVTVREDADYRYTESQHS